MKVFLPNGDCVSGWQPGDLIGGTGFEPFDPRGAPGIRIEAEPEYDSHKEPDPHVPAPVQSPADASPFTLTAIGALLNEPDDTQSWVVEGIIPAGGVGVVASKPKVGKSTLIRNLAVEVASPLGGGKWLGRSCASGPVWYLAFEGRRCDIKEHFRQLGATAEHALHVFIGQAPGNVVAAVRKLADQRRPALIIVDTMQRFLRAKSNDDYAEMTTLLDAVIAIARSSGAAVLLLHHAGKADRASIDAILGSTAIAGSADCIILLARHAQYRTIATTQRVGIDLEETVLLLDEATGRVRLGGSRHDADGAAVATALRQALSHGPLTSSALLESVEARRQVKLEALRQLLKSGTVLRSGAGTKTSPFQYAKVDAYDSGSQVPTTCGEPESFLPISQRPSRGSASDSGSQGSPGSCSALAANGTSVTSRESTPDAGELQRTTALFVQRLRDRQELVEERAAILEFDGRYGRAEATARAEVLLPQPDQQIDGGEGGHNEDGD